MHSLTTSLSTLHSITSNSFASYPMLPLLQTHLHIQHHPHGLLQCLLLYNTNHLSCYSDDSTISHNKRSNYDQTTTITFP